MKKRPWQLLLAGATSVVVLGALIGFAFLATYYYLKPTLPDVAAIRKLKLQVPLRVYSRDGLLIGQIGVQRRLPVAYADVPHARAAGGGEPRSTPPWPPATGSS